MKRPDLVTDEMLEYLDDLRESGVTNMWGAPAFVEQRYDMEFKDASTVVTYWMKTFGKESR